MNLTKDTQLKRGILLGLLAMFIFSMVDFIWKTALKNIPFDSLLLLDKIVFLFVLVVIALVRGISVRPKSPRQIFLYALFSLIELGSFTTALSRVPLTELWVLILTTPLITAFAAGWLLGEKLSRRQIVALGVAFIAVVTMLVGKQSSTIDLHTLSVVGLLAVAVNVFANTSKMIVLRRGRQLESTISLSLWSAVLTILLLCAHGSCSGILAADQSTIWLVALGSIMGGSAVLLFLTAIKAAPASIVAPTQYSQMLWSALAGYYIFNEPLLPTSLVGAVLVVISGGIFYWKAKADPFAHS